ncbi:hypothetical protein DSECCO2_446320 [anaerobic digester metagenome]
MTRIGKSRVDEQGPARIVLSDLKPVGIVAQHSISDRDPMPVLERLRRSQADLACTGDDDETSIVCKPEALGAEDLDPYLVRCGAGCNVEELLDVYAAGLRLHSDAGIDLAERDEVVRCKAGLPPCRIVPDEIGGLCIGRLFARGSEGDRRACAVKEPLFQRDPLRPVLRADSDGVRQIRIGDVRRTVEGIGIIPHFIGQLPLVFDERHSKVHQLDPAHRASRRRGRGEPDHAQQYSDAKNQQCSLHFSFSSFFSVLSRPARRHCAPAIGRASVVKSDDQKMTFSTILSEIIHTRSSLL